MCHEIGGSCHAVCSRWLAETTTNEVKQRATKKESVEGFGKMLRLLIVGQIDCPDGRRTTCHENVRSVIMGGEKRQQQQYGHDNDDDYQYYKS
jgi:hypothetical protein